MTVEEIVLNYALLGDNGASDFADWYKINKDAGTLSNLERISLQLNDISDVGVVALAKSLCSTGTGCDTSPVKELSLHTNDIGYGGAQAVANFTSRRLHVPKSPGYSVPPTRSHSGTNR